jgi:hypothetical protein
VITEIFGCLASNVAGNMFALLALVADIHTTGWRPVRNTAAFLGVSGG